MGLHRSRTRVQRWLAGSASGMVAAVLVSACGSLPDGVDGDITSDWGGFEEPAPFVPAAPACHQQPFRSVAPLLEYEPVDCDEPHLLQTIHVGFLDDLDEDLADPQAPPPEPGAEPLRDAYELCEEQAEDLLGADFRHGRLWLGVATPSDAGWEGGSRWFRCELTELESVYGDPVERTGSLADALADDPSGYGLGCFVAETDEDDEETVTEMQPVSCDEVHQAEFVGVWRAPAGDYPDYNDDDARARVYEGCREQVADYVGVPVDGDLKSRTGTIADWMSELDWNAGDRGFRCYLYLPGSELTESLAGAGTSALPVITE